jgi:hypothetical protein
VRQRNPERLVTIRRVKKLSCRGKLLAIAILVLCLDPIESQAGARRFTYVYEATPSAPGAMESENWVTWGTSMREDRRFNEVNFRHEIEIGVTDHFQAGLYFADWSYLESPAQNQHGFSYDSLAIELIYNLSNPTTDFLGAAVYQEIRGGPEIFELESKLILQKNVERFVFAYNATLEAKWEGRDWSEQAGAFTQSLGISYEISPSWSVGVEMLHEIDLPEWAAADGPILYGGPNISYRHANWWATVTPLVQLTNIRSEVDLQTRMIFGFSF